MSNPVKIEYEQVRSCLTDLDCATLQSGKPLVKEWCIWILDSYPRPLKCGIAPPCAKAGILVQYELAMILNPKVQVSVTQVEIEYDANGYLAYSVVDNGVFIPLRPMPTGCGKKFTITGHNIRGIVFRGHGLNTATIHNVCADAMVPITIPQFVPMTVDLSPYTATNPTGGKHTVTATVSENGIPMSDITVEFEITTGPNKGQTIKVVTNAQGKATFTYADTGGAGTDTIVAFAYYPNGTGVAQSTAYKLWGTLQGYGGGITGFGTSPGTVFTTY